MLWHYCAGGVLEKILAPKANEPVHELWATHFQYLNDTQELETAVKGLTGYMESLGTDSAKQFVNDYLSSNFSNVLGSDISLVSLSEAKDDLAQWRGYGSEKLCFAIGFSKTALQAWAGKNQIRLMQCVYTEQALYDIGNWVLDIFEKLNNKLVQMKAYPEEHPMRRELGKVASQDSVRLRQFQWADELCIYKHPKFNAELEWRLVIRDVLADQQKWPRSFFVSGQGLYRPHRVLRLDRNVNGQPLVRKVIVGPHPHASLIRSTVESFVRSNGMDIEVSTTCIPYRNW